VKIKIILNYFGARFPLLFKSLKPLD